VNERKRYILTAQFQNSPSMPTPNAFQVKRQTCIN